MTDHPSEPVARLSADQVLDAFAHPSEDVRTAALEYFAESYSPDPAVMPAVIRAIERFGWEAAFGRRHLLSQLTQTDDTVRWLIGQLRQETAADPQLTEDLVSTLIQADPELLGRHGTEIDGLANLGEADRTAIRERVALLTVPPDDLWRQLVEACAAFDHLDEFPERADLDRADRLAAALAAHPSFVTDRVAAILRGETDDQGNWLELYAVRIARHMRLAAAVPWLVDRLHEEDDVMLEEVEPALSAIGSDDAVGLFREAWPTAGWTFRFMAGCVLESLHSDRSVEAALALAATEADRGVRCRLYEAAVRNFSPSAVEPIRQYLLRAPEDMDTRQLRSSLLTACELMDVRFPEYSAWKAEEASRAAAAARRIAALDRSEIEEPPIPPGTIVREGPVVGRNDPCPCGSGRKFKKCCGKNR